LPACPPLPRRRRLSVRQGTGVAGRAAFCPESAGEGGMRLSISNIAWPLPEEAALAGRLRGFGATAVEVAPTCCWPQPLQATPAQLREYRAFWEGHGLPVVALQALLFGRPELQ